MNAQKLIWGILIAGGIWVTVSALVPIIIVLGFSHSQPILATPQNWFSLDGFYELLQRVMGLIMLAAMLAFPVGSWTRIARRRIILERLDIGPIPHGKYLRWGRNCRRHASIPARYSGLRPRKRFRRVSHKGRAAMNTQTTISSLDPLLQIA